MTEKASIKEKTKRGKGKANCGKASLFDVSPSKPERVGPELLCLRGEEESFPYIGQQKFISCYNMIDFYLYF